MKKVLDPITFLFISTNQSWGGSEILWYKAAEKLQSQGYRVAVLTYYDSEKLKIFDSRLVARSQFKQVVESSKMFGIPFKRSKIIETDQWTAFIEEQKPTAAIISQGNNTASLQIAELITTLKIPYLTVSQLVSEVHYLHINNENISRHQRVYSNAKVNFFVSQNNLELHEKMMGHPDSRNELIQNPIANFYESPLDPLISNTFDLAFVARLECLHKGLDLLLEIAKSKIWQSRELRFNIYGKGPHESLVLSYQKKFGLSNINLHGFTPSIKEIWQNNHMLFLPSRMEGQSLALLEALWYGRGAIVTDVGGASELIENEVTGFIAPFPTLNSIEQALELAWNHRSSWGQIGSNAAAKIRKLYPSDPVDSFVDKIMLTFKKH